MQYGGLFELDRIKSEILDLEEKISSPNFWNEQEVANEILEKLKDKKSLYEPAQKIKLLINDLNTHLELLQYTTEEEQNFKALIFSVEKQIENIELLTYLNHEFDKNNAVFEIHAGAGGTESCDWANMLARMYEKYFDKKGYAYEILDETPGEEVGIKTKVYLVRGNYSYGYLKNEKGVHRLVRLSPFDSNNRRHTSFAAVDVIPEFDNNINIYIKEADLKIDVYRSSGAGGQGVNTTDSAVRVTHIPTGIVVTCQNERSQIKNKETAIKVLKSKLYQIELKNKKNQVDSMKKDNNSIEFGSQIRSYVMHPYSMVKDHRTNYETSNVSKVLDGNIDEFIEANMKGENNETI